MGMYGERLGRGVTREAARKYETSVTERALSLIHISEPTRRS